MQSCRFGNAVIELLRCPAPVHSQNTPGDERIFQQCDDRLRGLVGSADASNGMHAGQPIALGVVGFRLSDETKSNPVIAWPSCRRSSAEFSANV